MLTPSFVNQAIRASGSHTTLASQTLALSSDTSIPAYCSMVVPSMMLEQAKA
jgi:hypothetical protein